MCVCVTVSIDGGRRIASQQQPTAIYEISFASNIPRIITGPYFLIAILYNLNYKEFLLLVAIAASGYLLLSSLPNCEYKCCT